MAGITNDILNAENVNFTGTNPTVGSMTADGQLLIGASSAPFIRPNTLTAGPGISITNGPGSISIDTALSSSTVQLSDDFIGWSYNASTTTVNANLSWINGGTNNFTSPISVLDNGHPGLITHSALAGDYAYLALPDGSTSNPSIILGGGEVDISFTLNIVDMTNLVTLFGFSNSSFTAWLGFGGPVAGNFWSFRYFSGVQIDLPTAVVMTTGWHTIRMVVSANAEQIQLYIDGVLALSPNFPADYPNVPTDPMYPIFMVQSLGGAITAGSVVLDLFSMKQTLTTPR